MEQTKQRIPWAAWVSVAFALPVLYALSIGPACWLVTRNVIPLSAVKAVFGPLVRLITASPRSVNELARRYCDSPVTTTFGGHRRLDAPFVHMQYETTVDDMLRKAGISITEPYILPYTDKSGSVGLTDLRARWRAWNSGDDLHETAMRCWDGEGVSQ